MIGKLALGLMALAMLLFVPSRAVAQDSAQHDVDSSQTANSNSSHAKMRRLTGCIVRGDGGDEYKFSANNGTVWQIDKTNPHIRIDPYVGHTVTAVGTLTPDPYSEKDANAGPLKRDLSKNHAGMFNITKVTNKGAACTH